jgi:hypothetical protein
MFLITNVINRSGPWSHTLFSHLITKLLP